MPIKEESEGPPLASHGPYQSPALVRWMRQQRLLLKLSPKHEAMGMKSAVSLGWLIPDDTRRTFERLGAALELIAVFAPARLAQLHRDIDLIWITLLPGVLGSYRQSLGWCAIDAEWMLEGGTSDAEIASTIIHEATHARLYRLGFRYEAARHVREERICFKTERNFGFRLPLDIGKQIIEQAERNLVRDPAVFTDEARETREMKFLRDAGMPEWLVRWLARRGHAFRRKSSRNS